MNTHQLNIRLLEVEVRTQEQRAQAAHTEVERFFAKLSEEIDHGLESRMADFERESLLLVRAKFRLEEALKAEPNISTLSADPPAKMSRSPISPTPSPSAL